MLNEGLRTFTAAVALGEGERVVVTSGTLTSPPEVSQAPTGATAQHIGYAEYPVAIGELVTVRPRSMSGTKQAVASAAFVAGATLYGSAAGRVSGTVSGAAIGVAVEAATAAGDIIEIIEY